MFAECKKKKLSKDFFAECKMKKKLGKAFFAQCKKKKKKNTAKISLPGAKKNKLGKDFFAEFPDKKNSASILNWAKSQILVVSS